MGGRTYGYARVSATDQNVDRQREALAGVGMLVEEKVSGKSRDGREKLKSLIEFADEGDVVRVKSIDRLARNTSDLLAIVDELATKGVDVEFVDTPRLNVTTKEGRAMLTILAAFAQLERESIRERQMEGIALAKAAGKYAKGPKLTRRTSRGSAPESRGWRTEGGGGSESRSQSPDVTCGAER